MYEVDFIVVVRNQLEYTRRCIQSILTTVAPVTFHLIVVDNASDDGTSSYLASLRTSEQEGQKVTILTNQSNTGYGAGLNLGLQKSHSPFVFLCNNDIEFFPKAVSEMISLAVKQPRFGLINPNSNEFGLAGYDQTDLQAKRGKWIERCHTSGFCVLVRREVIDQIGGIEPAYGFAYFEDMDYAERAKRAGFLCAVAQGAYVHHYGTRTFLPSEKQELWRRNRKLFLRKWGGTKWFAYISEESTLADPEKTLSSVRRLLTIAREHTAIIHLFISPSSAASFENIHDSFRMVKGPPFFRDWQVVLKIGRSFFKKPISRIFVENEKQLRIWESLKPFHRAQVGLLEKVSIASR